MQKLLKEPLVHFLAGAMLIFAYFWAFGPSNDPLSYEITIGASDIDRITADSIRTSNRLPTHEEVSALIDQAVKEEIYYREALRLGLDDGDAIIRRRLSNKMRSLNNSEIGTPSDAQLKQFLKKNVAQYSDQSRYAFDHIYIGRNTSSNRHKEWLKGLRDGNLNVDSIKAPLSIEDKQPLSNESMIIRRFGSSFTDALAGIKMNIWSGPIESGFGQHFVYIHERQNITPKLDDIRQRLSNDWRTQQIARSEKQIFDDLSKEYHISIAPIK